MIIYIFATGNLLSARSSYTLTTHSQGYPTVVFDLGEDLSDKSIEAVFRNGNITVRTSVISGQCDIPFEVMQDVGHIHIGLRGVQDTPYVAIPTNFVSLPIIEGVDESSGLPPASPTPSAYDEVRQLAEQSNIKADGAVKAADTAVKTAGTAVQAANAAGEKAEQTELSLHTLSDTVARLPIKAISAIGTNLFWSFRQDTAPGYYLVTASTATTNMPFSIGNGYLLIQFTQTSTGGRYVLTAQNAEKYAYTTGTPSSNGTIIFGAWTVIDLSTVATQAYVDGLVGSINDALEARLGGTV